MKNCFFFRLSRINNYLRQKCLEIYPVGRFWILTGSVFVFSELLSRVKFRLDVLK
jgi:hypothetical protein